jgi:aminoglycoside/choline kinase family phosphotransferase
VGEDAEARDWLARQCGRELRALEAMPGGAGARRYWRVHLRGAGTRVLMHALPEDPAILPPALRRTGEELPFVAIARLLAARGVPVPEIHALDPRHRWVLLEDVGDTHLCDLAGEDLQRRSAEAVELLARVHELPDPLPFERRFDAEWVRFELATFERHGAPRAAPARLAEALGALAEWIAALPRVLCLRDYQSQNLMVDARGRLRVLDFQDALLAPPELDLAAFLWDSYVERSEAAREALLGRYWAARRASADRAALAALVVQRKCKDLGRYRFVSEHKGDARYAPYVPRARAAVLGALGDLPAELGETGAILREALAEP